MIKLKLSERPTIWFFKTINESNSKGIPRARLVEGQMIPTEEVGSYVDGNIKLNVDSDHDLRKSNPVGSIFYTTSIKLIEIVNREGYYSTPPKVVDLVSNNTEVVDIHRAFLKTGKTPRLKATETASEVEEFDITTTTENSTLATLLKKYPIPTAKTDHFYVSTKNWGLLLMLHNRRKHMLLSGPSGVAKTRLARLLAQRLNVDFFKVDFSSKLDPISSLLGTHRHDPTNGSYFDRSPFLEAIQKPGIILLDEINRAGSEANNILFPLLDNDSRALVIDQEMGIKDRVVKLHPDCIFVATCNQGPEFTGTKSLDPAFKARFGNIPIDYLPAKEECGLLVKLTKCDKKNIETVVAIANEIRALYLSGEITEGIGVRETISACEMISDGLPMEHSLEFAFVNPFSKDEQPQVKDVLSGH